MKIKMGSHNEINHGNELKCLLKQASYLLLNVAITPRSAPLHANGQLAKVKPFFHIAPSFQKAHFVCKLIECVMQQLRDIAPPFGAF